nr:translocase of chloroplast 159, chloroplastic-like isoform X1 [Ipomoea trifida]GLL31475.1 translocase of chloroplast 159, chloroplastic-like isoform X1 [Ipomoea trifida]GLL44805.1 translocase of chloroplast 159, chloroplastic-like isoform X1 [Ipomoea trifida]
MGILAKSKSLPVEEKTQGRRRRRGGHVAHRSCFILFYSSLHRACSAAHPTVMLKTTVALSMLTLATMECKSVEEKSNLHEFDDDYISSLTGPDVGNVGYIDFRQGIRIALLSVDNEKECHSQLPAMRARDSPMARITDDCLEPFQYYPAGNTNGNRKYSNGG